MKLQKLLCSVLTLTLLFSLCGTMPVNAREASPVLYVADGGTGDGSSVDSPLAGLSEAAELLPQGGTIVICGDTLVETQKLPSTEGTLVITSVYQSQNFKEQGAALRLSGTLTLSGATCFENLNLTAVKSNSLIIGDGFPTVLGKGISCTKDGSSNYIGISGGSNITGTDSHSCQSADLAIQSGTWQLVRGGNRRQTGGASTIRTLNGDIRLTITGGTFVDSVSGGGQNHQEGTIFLTISGGVFKKGVYGTSRFGGNAGDGLHNGNVNIRIIGGEFQAGVHCIWKDNPETVFNGQASVSLDNGEFSGSVKVKGTEGVTGNHSSTLTYNRQNFAQSPGQGFDAVKEVDGDPGEIVSIRVLPKTLLLRRGEKYKFSAEISPPGGEVVWSVDSENSAMSEDGVLYVSETEQKECLEVRASLAENPEVYDTAVVSLASVSQVDGEPAVFVRNGGEGDGSSADSPLGSLENAFEILKNEGGLIVICGPVSLTQELHTPEGEQRYRLTSVAGGTDYRETADAALSMKANLSLQSPVIIENVNFIVCKTNLLITCNGNKTVFGEGIVCTQDGSSNYIGITAGVNVTTGEEESLTGTDLTIQSGDWQIVRGGNRRGISNVSQTRSTIEGDVSLTISGGTFWGLVTGGGQNSQNGNIDMEISGGVFQKGVFGLCDPGENGYQSTHTGDVSLSFSDGEVMGTMAASSDYANTRLDGTFSVRITGGNLLRLDSIVGSEEELMPLPGENSSWIEVDQEMAESYAGEHTVSFQNPIMPGADPSISLHNGTYYMMKAGGLNGQYCLYMYEASSIAGLASAQRQIVWMPEDGLPWSEDLWSPKLYYLDDDWYIYVACDDGDNANHRVYVLKAKTEDPMGEYEFLGALQGDKLQDSWAIGPHICDYQGKRYYFFTGRDENNTEQYLYAAEMESPTQLKSTPVIICKPDYDWEKVGSSLRYPKVVEGATPLFGPDGTFHIIYSASGSWCDGYCLGRMTLRDGGDPLNPDDWVKFDQPVLRTYEDADQPENNVYGPGHAAFLNWTDENGARVDWIVYHGQLVSGAGWTGRSILAQPFTWDEDDNPVFGHPDLESTFSFETEISSLRELICGFTETEGPETEQSELQREKKASVGWPLPTRCEVRTFRSDTTWDLTVKEAYQFRITSLDGHAPVMTLENTNFRVELASREGNDYFYKIHAQGSQGSTCGVYVDGCSILRATVG